MSSILWVFGSLEALLIVVCVLTFIWGLVRRWELEILLPFFFGFFGTLVLAVAFVVAVVAHDHLHFHLS
jgi:hypothetical protein